jgi:hypothetical protein
MHVPMSVYSDRETMSLDAYFLYPFHALRFMIGELEMVVFGECPSRLSRNVAHVQCLGDVICHCLRVPTC